MLPDLRPHRAVNPSVGQAAGASPQRTQCEDRELPTPHFRRITLAATAAALLLTPAAAQRVPPADATAYTRAIAAGYKAAMYCSGIFTAGRTPAQIDRDELTGIYPEYEAIVPTLTARVEPFAVRVAFDPALPPRRAVWNARTGCTTLPIGAPASPIAPPVHPTPAGPDPRAWPVGDSGITQRTSPALAAVVQRAYDGTGYGAGAKTTGVLVLRNGAIAAERYADGWGPYTANRTWSVGKSIAGTLVGLVAATRPLDVRAGGWVPEWRTAGDPRRAIRLDDLLRMGSGLHTDTAGNRTDLIYFGGGLVTEDAIHWPLEAPPATRFRYSNTDILLAIRGLRATVGEQAYRDLPATRLFAPLGMAHTQAGTDWQGNYILSSQIWSTARDLARLGQFWLQDGVWQGRRLLPPGWMRYLTTPSGPQPADGPGYGATMWLFGPKQGLPAGSYAAQGNRGQYVMVIPSAKLVVVRRGEDPGAARFDIAKFSADILATTR